MKSPVNSPQSLSDSELVARLKALVRQENSLVAEMLTHIGEVDARKLYAFEACSSMFGYATSILGFSEPMAFKRITAARLARRFPAILKMVAMGQLHLAGVNLLSKHLTEENHRELLSDAAGKSKRQIEKLIAKRFPMPGPASSVRKLPVKRGVTAEKTEPLLFPQPRKPASVKPTAPREYSVRFTASERLHDLMEEAQNLLRHRIPDGDLPKVLECLLEKSVADLKRKKYGAAKPRAKTGEKPSSRSRHIPADVRREVLARDGAQCAYVDLHGRRCQERGFLEFDHKRPFALNGEHTSDNVRILCRTHNQQAAREIFGTAAIAAVIEARSREERRTPPIVRRS